MRGVALRLVLLVALATTMSPPPEAQAFYGTCASTWTTSRYLRTNNSTTLYNMGYTLGQKVAAGQCPVNTLVVLAFGGPFLQSGVYGTCGAGGGSCAFMSNAGIAVGVEQFGKGFYDATPAAPMLTIGVGTNNSTVQVGTTAGANWGSTVNTINTWFANSCGSSLYRCNRQVLALGANDMETGWDSPTATIAWINGYRSASTWFLLDFGDAGGCPQTSYTTNGGCNQSFDGPNCSGTNSETRSWGTCERWYQSQVAKKIEVDYGDGVPEIYNTSGANAQQWRMIGLYAWHTLGWDVNFSSSLTQWQACTDTGNPCTGTNNQPVTGWQQLNTALNSSPQTAQTIPYATDISWSTTP